MNKVLFHKYPRQNFCGNIIKGYAEIEKDQRPFEINFIVNFSCFAPKKAEEYFKGDIEEYQKFLQTEIFDTRKMAKRLRALLPSEGYFLDAYLCFLFAYEHNPVKDVKKFQKIYGPLTVNVRFNVTRELQKVQNNVKDYNDFIAQMLVSIDGMFRKIENESQSLFMFIPRDINKFEENKKIHIINTLSEDIVYYNDDDLEEPEQPYQEEPDLVFNEIEIVESEESYD